jgi:hypothetical protein
MKGKLHYKGGKGSGNFGHTGRKGLVGGSAPDETIRIAVSATRSYMRSMGIDPSTQSSDQALLSLDDLSYENTVAGNFANNATDSDIKRFKKEWEKWLKLQ